MQRWGAFVARRAGLVLLVGVLATIGAGWYGFGVFDSLSNGGFEDPASESSQERLHELDTFGNKAVDVVAIYSSDDLSVTDPAFEAEVQKVVAGLPSDKVSSVATWYDKRTRPCSARTATPPR